MWTIVFWVFAVIGMITTLVGVGFLLGIILGLIFSGSSNECGSSSHRDRMEELCREQGCHFERSC